MAEKSVKSIIFDFGGVVVDYDPERYLRGLFDDGAVIEYVMEHLFESAYWRMFDEDRFPRDEADAVILREARRDGFGPQMELVQARWTEHMRTKPETVELIKDLRAAGYGVYYLTNMPRDMWEVFTARGLPDLFMGGVASFELGLTKPRPAIYRELLRRCSLDPGTCVFLDDMPRNIAGAERAGLRGIVFTDAASARAELSKLGVELRGDR